MRPLGTNLLIQFSAVSFVLMGVLAIVLAVTLSNRIRSDAIGDVAEEAVGSSRGRLLAAITPSDLAAPMTGDAYDRFDEFVRTSIVSDRTALVKLWGTDGTILYSTEPGEVGAKFPDNEGLLEALRGNKATEVRAPGASELELLPARLYDTPLVEVYIPVIFPGATEPQGAFEVYQYYAPTAQRIESLRNWVFGSIALGFAVLYGSLVSIVLSASRTIVRQGDQLKAINTELAEVNAEIAREQSTLASVQDSIAEGLLVTDLHGRIVYFNRTLEEFFGCSAQGYAGTPFDLFLLVKEPVFEGPNTSLALAALVRGPVSLGASLEVVVLQPRRRELLVMAFPVEVKGQPQMQGFLVRDITMERDLERRRNEFVSIASHEMRTPLTTISGFAKLLLDRDVPKATQRQWLDQVYRDSQRLTGVVEDLLDLSRIQSGRLALNLEVVPVREAVDEALKVVRPLAEQHQFIVAIAPDVSEMVSDRSKLTHILMNLLSNAVKYSPSGGHVVVSAYRDLELEGVVFTVADQGIGIARDEQERLFTSFHRIKRPETERIRGTGLGLYIVKALVQMMGGRVWVDSELNRGSTFSFWLPARPANADLEAEWISVMGGDNGKESARSG